MERGAGFEEYLLLFNALVRGDCQSGTVERIAMDVLIVLGITVGLMALCVLGIYGV